MADRDGGHAKRVLTLMAAALLATAAMALGQEPVRLTLDEAIELARENNLTPGPLPADRGRPWRYADARKFSRREGCQSPAHDPSGPYSR